MSSPSEEPEPFEEHESMPRRQKPTATSAPVEHAFKRTRKKLSQLGDPFGTKPPKRRWLLRRNDKGVFPLGKVGILAAAGGVGKTMAVVQLALAVATGTKKWMGAFDVAAEGVGRVLLALGEEDEAEMHRRLYHAARAMNLSPVERASALDRIEIMPLQGEMVALTQTEEDGREAETEAAKTFREELTDGAEWRLIVLDPLSRFAGPDVEKDNAAATRFITTVESFCKLPGSPTVLVVHHSAQAARGKDSDRTDASHVARGATGITDGARWVASMQAERLKNVDEHLRHLANFDVYKNNYAAPSDGPIDLRRDLENGGALRALEGSEQKMVNEARATEKTTREKQRNGKTAGDATEKTGSKKVSTDGYTVG